MSNNQKFSFELDFNTKFKIDKAEIDKMAKTVEDSVSVINPDIKIDADELRKGITQAVAEFSKLEDASRDIDKLLSGLDLNLNSKEAQDALKEIESMIKDIDNVDLSKIDEALKGLGEVDLTDIAKGVQQAFENIDTDNARKQIAKLANEYESVKKETASMINQQRAALAQMKLSGMEGTESYQVLEKEIDNNIQKLEELTAASKGANDATAKIGESAGATGSFMDFAMKFQAVGALGETLSGFAEKGMEARTAMRELSAQTGLTGEALDTLRETANSAFLSGVGDSIGEAIKSIGTAQQQLGKFLDTQGIKDFTVAASGIAKTFDVDVNETIRKSRTFIANYGLDGKKAGELVSYAFQQTGSEDILDTLDEYSQLMVKAGYSAEEFVGVLSNGMKNGTRDTDKLADSIKETQIRLNAGDTSKAVGEIKSSVSAQINAIVASAEAGQISVKEMSNQTAKLLAEAASRGDITAAIRDQYATALSGTMAEDMGGEMWAKIFSAKIDPSAVTEQAKTASEQINAAMQPTTFAASVEKRLEVLKTSLSETLGPVANQLGSALQSVSSVAPGLSVMGEQLGKLGGYIGNIGGLSNAMGALSSGALGAAKSFITMGAAFIATPIGAAIAAAVALVAAIKLISSLVNKTAEDKLKEARAEEEALNAQKKSLEIQKDKIKSNQDLIKSYEDLGAKTNRTAEEESKLNDIKVKLAGAYPGVISGTKSFAENLSALKTAAANGQGELDNLNTRLADLNKAVDRQHLVSVNLEVDASKESMEDKLTAKFSEISWDKALNGAKVGAAAGAVGGAAGAAMGAAAGAAIAPFGDKISEFLFGTSTARKQSESMIKPYTDAMYKATNSAELEKATTDFKVAIMNNTNIDEKMKGDLLKNIDDMNAKKAKAIEEGNKVTAKLMTEGLKISYKDGVMTDEEINQISKKYGKTEAEVRKLFDTVKAEANKTKVGEVIKGAMEIQGNIKSNEKVDALVKNYKNAKTEIERSQIGDVLSKAAPGAIQATQMFVDSNGKLRTSYKLLDDKVKESTTTAKQRYSNDLKAKQDELVSMIEKEGAGYQKTKQRMEALTAEINKKKKLGLDTSDLEKQVGDLGANLQSSEKDLVAMGSAAIKTGKDSKEIYSQLAKETGKTPAEVKKLIIEQQKSESLTKSQVNSVKSLADAWASATKATSENVTQGIAALSEMQLKRKEILKKDPNQRTDEEKKLLEEYNAEYKKRIKDTATQVKQEKEQAKILENVSIATGKTEVDRLAKAKEQYGIDSAKLEINKLNFDYTLKNQQIAQKRAADSYDELLTEKENLKLIQAQGKAWEKAVKDKGLVKNIKEDGTVVFNSSVKAADKAEILKTITDTNVKIAESRYKISDLFLKVKVDSEQVEKDLMDLRAQQIDWEISIGIRNSGDYSELLEYYKTKGTELTIEAQNTNAKILEIEKKHKEDLTRLEYLLTDEQKEAMNFRYKMELNEARKAYIKAEKDLLENNKKIQDATGKGLAERLAAIDKYYDEEKEKSAKANAENLAQLNIYLDKYSNARKGTYDKNKARELSLQDESGAEQLKNLDALKQLEIITEEDYNKRKESIAEASAIRKAAIEEKYRKQALKAEAFQAGFKQAAQADSDLAAAELEKKRLKAKLSELDQIRINNGGALDKNQKEQYDALKKSLDNTDKLIEEKGTLFGKTLSAANDGIQNALTGLFAGNAEAAADGVRQMFAGIFGAMAEALTKEAQAVVLKLVLDWLYKDVSTEALPLFAKLALIPMVNGLVGGTVNAIVQPTIAEIASFSTGARVNEPTLAIIGDAKNSGNRTNSETVLTDPQLIALLRTATIGASIGLIQEVRLLRAELAAQTLETSLKGEDLRLSYNRSTQRAYSRAR